MKSTIGKIKNDAISMISTTIFTVALIVEIVVDLVSIKRTEELMDKMNRIQINFIPAAKFEGAKKEYIFKHGDQGLGYYTDRYTVAMNNLETGDGQDSSGVEGDKSVHFIPAKTFSGAKKGYVFKNGEQGLGYYTDRHAIAERKQGNGGK